MDVKKLYEMIAQDEMSGQISKKLYWNGLWDIFIEEKSCDYQTLQVKEAIPRLISEQNLRARRNTNNCVELGVDIRVGDICYIDYGEAYINDNVCISNIYL